MSDEEYSQSEQIVDGATCSHCGVCFEESHGFPVLCHDCFVADRGKSGIQESTELELG